MNVISVEKLSVRIHLLLSIGGSTLERNLMSVWCVENISLDDRPLLYIRLFTLERSRMNAVNVGRPSARHMFPMSYLSVITNSNAEHRARLENCIAGI